MSVISKWLSKPWQKRETIIITEQQDLMGSAQDILGCIGNLVNHGVEVVEATYGTILNSPFQPDRYDQELASASASKKDLGFILQRFPPFPTSILFKD